MFCSEQQREIVGCEHRNVIINGCAGSRKTDTLVKKCLRLYAADKNILIVTLVGSVTNEIKERLEAALGTAFRRQGNHYLVEGATACIEIANYDAMLHKQLSVHKDPFLWRYGDCFEEKAALLHEKYVSCGKHKAFFMANNRKADVLMMDEFQDLHPLKARILTDVIKTHGDMIAFAAGDYVQSIFDHAFQPDEDHPMDIWRKELDAHQYHMSMCFRCPKAHVDLVNKGMAPYYAKYNVPPMQSTNDDTEHMPVIFLSPSGSRNHTADVVAKQVEKAIVALMEIDTDVRPSDIAIIMAKSNRNAVFKQLEYRLNHVYAARGHHDCVKLFETKGDGYTRPIDWNKAEGKTVLLSIHGDKGKGHKVVFFMGCTEGMIPNKTRLFTNKELIDVSLFNVALSRSTRWLFISMTREMPCRYVRDIGIESLRELSVLSWDKTTWRNDSFTKICSELNKCYEDILPEDDARPVFENPNYVKQKINAPDKFMVDVQSDVASMFEHPKQLAPKYPWCDVKSIQFGAPARYVVKDEHMSIFGVMGELMFQRHYCLQRGEMQKLQKEFGFLLDAKRVHYTNNDKLLNIVQDEQLNMAIKNNMGCIEYVAAVGSILSRYSNYIHLSTKLREEIAVVTVYTAPKFIVSDVLKRADLVETIRLFLSDTPSSELPPTCFWDTAVIYNVLYDRIRCPSIYKAIGAFKHDLTPLMDNVDQFYHMIKALDLTFHKQYKLVAIENDPCTLQDMGLMESQHVALGIVGVSDFETDNATFEVKCPFSSGYNNQWTLQPLMYHCLNTDNRKIEDINVIDLTNGCWYQYPKIDTINKKNAVKTVLLKLKHREEHIKALVGQLC